MPSRVDFPSEVTVLGRSGGPSVEESFLEDQPKDMDDDLHPLRDLASPSSSISGETNGHSSPEAKSEVESHG